MKIETNKIARALALSVLAAQIAVVAHGQPVSEDFNKATLNTTLWTWIDPVGDSSYAITGFGGTDVHLSMTVPEGSGHDPWTDNFAAQLMQTVPNQDFEVVAKFDSVPALQNQQEGFLVRDSTGNNFLRFCLQFQNNNMLAYLIIIRDGNGGILYPNGGFPITTIPRPTDGNIGTAYLKLKRQSDQWTFSVSPNGFDWEIAYQPVQQAWTVAQLGPYVGNEASSAYTAELDYFFNTASPIAREDGQDPPNTPPTITMTTPVDGAYFTNPPANITLTADAQDTDGTIAKVEFYSGTNLLGTVTSGSSNSFSFTWNSPNAGVYGVTAKATDNRGAERITQTIAVLIAGTGLQPVSDDFNASAINSRWTQVDPATGGTFEVVGAGGVDPHLRIVVPGGANHDAWVVNESLLLLQPTADQNFQVEAKFDTLPAVANEFEGLIVRDEFENFLRFDVLADGTAALRLFVGSIIFGGGAQVTRVDISDVPKPALGHIGTVYLRVRRLGDQWTCSTSPDGKVWTQRASFTQAFTVAQVGVFAGNNTGNANPPEFSVLVDYFFNSLAPIALEDGQGPNTPPTVTMTAPVDHTLFTAPAQVTFTANASDSDGTIAKVEFYSVTNLLGTATSQPYNFNWKITNTGIYSVTAAATDNRGATTLATNSVTVLVGGPGLLPVSDDFNAPSLNSAWIQEDPVGDGTFETVGANSGDAHLQIVVPTGNEHDGWTVNNMLRLVQPVSDQDFELEAKFDTLPPNGIGSSLFEGISVENSEGVAVRFDAALDAAWDAASPSLRYWFGRNIGLGSAGQVASGTMDDFPKSTNTVGTIYLRVRRQGTTWTGFTSKDGAVWTQRAQFSDPLVPAMVGVHAGNAGSAAFTASVDYFFNSLAPITLEDGQAPTRPTLAVTRSDNDIVIAWPTSAAGYSLEGSASLTSPNWLAVNAAITVVGSQSTVTLPISGQTQFYRLKK
jgi:hypothetical protein